MSNDNKRDQDPSAQKEAYDFGGIEKFDLEKIESEILNDSIYLDVFAGSEPAFKHSIAPLTSSETAPILNLKTYRFQYNTKEFKDKNFPEGARLGLMADEVEKHFPECISKDADGYRHVNYSMLIAPLIQTIKTLEEKVSVLEKKISEKN